MKRRTFLKIAGSSLTVAASVGFYTWRIEPHWVEVVRRPMPIRGLPPSLVGKTLVHLSDIHVGTRVDDDYLIATFQRVAAMHPDIVVMSGDLTSYYGGILPQLKSVFTHVPQGRLATLAILGNHDYGAGWSTFEGAAGIAKTIAQCGVTVLRNEVYDAGGLQVVGLDDLWAGQFHPRGPLSQLDAQRPSIVLSHNPDTVDLPDWDGYQGWILAGHTHGGQCKPPFLPPPYLSVQNRRYTSGEFDLRGDRKLYINRGLGHLLQVRFNVRPEVTVFELCSSAGTR